MNFWQTPDWTRLKTDTIKSNKPMTRIEYLNYVSAKNYTEEKYQEYLKNLQKPIEENPEFLFNEY